TPGGGAGNNSGAGSTETAGAEPPVLPGLAALVLTPQVLIGGDNFSAEATPGTGLSLWGEGVRVLADFGFDRVADCPRAVAEAVVRGGVEAVGTFDGWSGAGSRPPAPTPSVEAVTGQAMEPVRVNQPGSAAGPGAGAASANQPGSDTVARADGLE